MIEHGELVGYIRELKQPRRRRQQKPPHICIFDNENSIFARFARAVFIFWHFVDVLVLSTTWNDLFCSCVDDVSIWWQMFIFVFLCPKRRFQFNSRIVRTHFSSMVTLNNWKMISETRSYIFVWRSRFRRRCVCLSSLLYQVEHEKRNSVSLDNHVLFYLLYQHLTTEEADLIHVSKTKRVAIRHSTKQSK